MRLVTHDFDRKQTDSLWIYPYYKQKLRDMSRVLVNKPHPLEAAFVQERDLVQELFGKRLRALRTEHKLTLEMLAERCDLHENYVGAVERGERNLSLFNVWRLANGLGLSASDLVQDLPPRKSKKSKSA